jgi:prepilin-type processing-associated H-X9-DG protein
VNGVGQRLQPLSYSLNRYFFYNYSTFVFEPAAATPLAAIPVPANRIFVTESVSSLGRELIGPSNLSVVVNGQPPLFTRHFSGATYLYADGHSKWHHMPQNWLPTAPGGIPSSAWSSVPAVATTSPTSLYQQWFPWTEGPEAW